MCTLMHVAIICCMMARFFFLLGMLVVGLLEKIWMYLLFDHISSL